MQKLGLPIVMLLAALLLSACSSPTDKPGRRWAKFLEAQTELVKTGKFDPAKFESEGTVIAQSLNAHRDPKTGKLLMTVEVLARFQAANVQFEEACKAADNQVALAAYARLASPLTEPGAANSP